MALYVALASPAAIYPRPIWAAIPDYKIQELARRLTAGQLDVGRGLGGSDLTGTTDNQRDALRKVPTEALLTILDSSPNKAARLLAAQVLAIQNNRVAFDQILTAFTKQDIEVLEPVVALYRSVELPLDLAAIIKNEKLSQGVREKAIQALRAVPTADSVEFLSKIYRYDPDEAGRPQSVQSPRSSFILETMGDLGRAEAIPFLKSLPKCVPFPTGRIHAKDKLTVVNPDRKYAIEALKKIGGPDAFAALIAIAIEEIDAECAQDDPTHVFRVELRYPWVVQAGARLYSMRGVAPNHLEAAVRMLHSRRIGGYGTGRVLTFRPLLVALLLQKPVALAALESLLADSNRDCQLTGEFIESAFDARNTHKVDLKFLKGSHADSLVDEALVGYAGKPKVNRYSFHPPLSWKNPPGDDRACLSSMEDPNGYIPKLDHIIVVAGSIGNPASTKSLIALYDLAYTSREPMQETQRPLDGQDPQSIIRALADIGTPDADAKLASIVDSNDWTELRDLARKGREAIRSAVHRSGAESAGSFAIKCTGSRGADFKLRLGRALVKAAFGVVEDEKETKAVLHCSINRSEKKKGPRVHVRYTGETFLSRNGKKEVLARLNAETTDLAFNVVQWENEFLDRATKDTVDKLAVAK